MRVQFSLRVTFHAGEWCSDHRCSFLGWEVSWLKPWSRLITAGWDLYFSSNQIQQCLKQLRQITYYFFKSWHQREFLRAGWEDGAPYAATAAIPRICHHHPLSPCPPVRKGAWRRICRESPVTSFSAAPRRQLLSSTAWKKFANQRSVKSRYFAIHAMFPYMFVCTLGKGTLHVFWDNESIGQPPSWICHQDAAASSAGTAPATDTRQPVAPTLQAESHGSATCASISGC